MRQTLNSLVVSLSAHGTRICKKEHKGRIPRTLEERVAKIPFRLVSLGLGGVSKHFVS